jgi:hypothetical protein
MAQPVKVLVEMVPFIIFEVEVVHQSTDGHHGPTCSNYKLHHDRHRSLIWKNSSQATYNKNKITMENSKRWLTANMV